MPDWNDFLNPNPPAPAAPQAPAGGTWSWGAFLAKPEGADEQIAAEKEHVRRRDAVNRIAGEEMENYLGGPGSVVTRPSLVFGRRLEQEAPWMAPQERQRAAGQFDQAVPRARQARQFQQTLAQERQGRQEAGGVFDPGFNLQSDVHPTVEYLQHNAPVAGTATDIAKNVALRRAAARYRAGQEDESDRRLLAQHLLGQEEEGQKGVLRKGVDLAAHVPAFVAEMELSGGLAGGAEATGGRLLGRWAAQAGGMAPGKLAQGMVPDINAGDQGGLQVGPPKSLAKEGGKALAESTIEVAAMHGVGKLGGEARGALGLSARPGVLAAGGFYGAPEFVAQGRAAELAEGLTGLRPDYGVAGGLFSDDHTRRAAAWKQVAAEALAGGLVGGGERALKYATAAHGEALQAQGYSKEATQKKVQADFAPLHEQLERLRLENAAGLNDLQGELTGQHIRMEEDASKWRQVQPTAAPEQKPAAPPPGSMAAERMLDDIMRRTQDDMDAARALLQSRGHKVNEQLLQEVSDGVPHAPPRPEAAQPAGPANGQGVPGQDPWDAWPVLPLQSEARRRAAQAARGGPQAQQPPEPVRRAAGDPDRAAGGAGPGQEPGAQTEPPGAGPAAPAGPAPAGRGQPAPVLSAAELARRLREGEEVPGLSPAQRADVHAHVVEGKTLEEVGAARGVTKEAVRQSVEKAAQALHGTVEEPGERQEAPEGGRGAVGSQDVPGRWYKTVTHEEVADALNAYVERHARQGTEIDAARVAELLDGLDREQMSGKRKGPWLKKAAQFLRDVNTSPEERQYAAAQEAAAPGVNAAARERYETTLGQWQKMKQLHLDLRNELARKHPDNPRYPSQWQSLAHEDADAIHGLDEVAGRFGGDVESRQAEAAGYPFGRHDQGDDVEGNVFRFLSSPLPEKPGPEDFHRQAWEEYHAGQARQGDAAEPAGTGSVDFDPLSMGAATAAARAGTVPPGAPGAGVPPPAPPAPATPPRTGMLQKAADWLRSLGQQTFPALTRLSRASGEKLAEASNARQAAKSAWDYYSRIIRVPNDPLTEKTADQQLKAGGKPLSDLTPDESQAVGAVWLERRLRHYRDELDRRADEAHAAAANASWQAALAKNPRDRDQLQEQARRMRQAEMDNRTAAGRVVTLVGQPGSPLATEQHYQNGLANLWPFFEAVHQEWAPEVDRNFRGLKGLDPADAIDAPSQIPGLPLNAIAADPNQAAGPGVVRLRQQGMENLNVRRPGFMRQAELAAPGYDVDVQKMMRRSLDLGMPAARRAEFFRQALHDGVLAALGPGEHAPPGYVDTGLDPARGLPGLDPNARYYVHPDAYKDVIQGLGIGQRPGQTVADLARPVMDKVYNIALMSPVELATHIANNLTATLKPGMGVPGLNLVETVKNAAGLYRRDPELLRKVMELTKISASFGHEAKPGVLGERLARYDPTAYANRITSGFIDVMQKAVRVQLGDAFDRMADAGHFERTDTAKRDFINQAVGNYNSQAGNRLAQFLKDTGLQSFATAAHTYTAQGVKSVLGGAVNSRTTGWRSEAQVRAQAVAKLIPFLALGPALNSALWGQAFPQGVPAFAVKTRDDDDGKTHYFDPLGFTGLRRGARATGVNAAVEGAVQGKTGGEMIDQAKTDALHSAEHMVAGPPIQFLHTAATGENAMGHRVSQKARPGQSQAVEDVKAAALNVNPLVGSFTQADRPRRPWTVGENLMQSAGPFGERTRQKSRGMRGR